MSLPSFPFKYHSRHYKFNLLEQYPYNYIS